MIISYNENKWGMDINMTPETPKEVAELLRISKNAKAEKPTIYFSFSDDKPTCYISLNKVKENVQINSINNKK
jgi:hypothetical protein